MRPQPLSAAGCSFYVATMSNGWIKLHRELLYNPIVKRPVYAWLWIVLLLKANHKEDKLMWNGGVLIVKEGQFVTGRKELSKESGIPPTTVERILDYLESEHQIEQQKTTKYRLITIVNWKDYQKADTTSDNKRTTNGQQTDTNNKSKNVKKNTSEAKASRVPVFSIQPEEESNRVYRNSPDMLDYATSLWEPVNPAAHNWYTKNKTERLNIDRLITEEGMEWLEKVTKMLPKTNGLQYFPVITTASLLYKKRADFKAAIEKQISKETTKKTIII